MDYGDFDNKLVRTIQEGVCTYSALGVRLKTEAAPFAPRPGEEDRVVDRRLQALRKKGVLKVSRRDRAWVWEVA